MPINKLLEENKFIGLVSNLTRILGTRVYNGRYNLYLWSENKLEVVVNDDLFTCSVYYDGKLVMFPQSFDSYKIKDGPWQKIIRDKEKIVRDAEEKKIAEVYLCHLSR